MIVKRQCKMASLEKPCSWIWRVISNFFAGAGIFSFYQTAAVLVIFFISSNIVLSVKTRHKKQKRQRDVRCHSWSVDCSFNPHLLYNEWVTGCFLCLLMLINEQKHCRIISPKGGESLPLLHPAPMSTTNHTALGKQPQFTAIRYTQIPNLYYLI